MLAIPTDVFTFPDYNTWVLEHTMVPKFPDHYLKGAVQQKVVCCYKNGKKKEINNGRETEHHDT